MASGLQIFKIAARATIEETQKALVATAKAAHKSVMGADPRPTRFTRFVDGVQGASEERVKPDGLIRYVYPRLDEVVQFALETLFDLSPVLSGEYRNHHLLFVDGVAVRNLENWTGGEIVIINVEPYARKIEVGTMKMRVEGSSRVYFQAADIVRGRFGNQSKISFTYRGAIRGGAIGGKKGNKSNLRYPALIISER